MPCGRAEPSLLAKMLYKSSSPGCHSHHWPLFCFPSMASACDGRAGAMAYIDAPAVGFPQIWLHQLLLRLLSFVPTVVISFWSTALHPPMERPALRRLPSYASPIPNAWATAYSPPSSDVSDEDHSSDIVDEEKNGGADESDVIYFVSPEVPQRRYGNVFNALAAIDPSALAAQCRVITPRPTPPPSPATEHDSPILISVPSTPSTGSYAPSSWTTDGSSFRERVAARLAKQRKAKAEASRNSGSDSGGRVHMLFNGREMYALAGSMGSGAGGRVMYAHNKDGQEVAIKVVHKARTYRHFMGRANVLNELRALRRVTESDLAFLCPVLSAWDDETNIYIVMPCLRENLLQRMERCPLSEKEVMIYSAEMIHALSSLHSSGVIHRDIKPENILFDAYGHIVLGDLGLAYTSEAESNIIEDVRLTELMGTPGYMAPEVIMVTSRAPYSWEVDVYSLGLVIFDMALGHLTAFYWGETIEDVKRKLILFDVPVWDVADGELRDMLTHMVARDPTCRWSAEALKGHRYYDTLHWSALETKDYIVKRPPPPEIDDGRRSISYSTFHEGRDSGYGNLPLDSKGEVVPNRHVLKQMHEDGNEPDAFKFSMDADYRRILLREFICDGEQPLHSRYGLSATPVHPIPPPPAYYFSAIYKTGDDAPSTSL
ncbi:kinase-like protein [Trametopsis cervina]|nr:kinase-like protein [Trametopsis cervina]